MRNHKRLQIRQPLIGAFLVLFGLMASGSVAQAQSISIGSPTNNATVSPGTHLDVSGSYTGGSSTSIRLRMWEVDSDDNPVGDPKVDKSLEDLAGGVMKSWGIGYDMPTLPPHTGKRYKITAQLLDVDGTTVLKTTSIFVSSINP